ncbi:hypothetical protein ANCDUO_12034 [Ancylostoma duodenale]|uniref:Uncharacterized protein n=1 Tax=Ancylostoma duodenale TaxID=51022 RepID=A0A0C2D6M6_9BILA|nr:hypothetical protein ANCDUO_12034 [Ancylostoma duodenale]
MPLKRITFSGRLAATESAEVWKTVARGLGPNKLANYFVTSTLLYLKYELTFALCVFLMEYLKCAVGRLRPHFLEACQPDWSRMDCAGRDSIPGMFWVFVMLKAAPAQVSRV